MTVHLRTLGLAWVQKIKPLHSHASDTERERGGDKELGEDQKINQAAIWHPGTLETLTTVCFSSVFSCGPSTQPGGWRSDHSSEQRGDIAVGF